MNSNYQKLLKINSSRAPYCATISGTMGLDRTATRQGPANGKFYGTLVTASGVIMDSSDRPVNGSLSREHAKSGALSIAHATQANGATVSSASLIIAAGNTYFAERPPTVSDALINAVLGKRNPRP